MLLGPDQNPRPVFSRILSRELVDSVMIRDANFQIIGLADIKSALRVLQNVNPEHRNGSRGRIRTYDQSVNPDCVGTLPLSTLILE